MIIDDKYINKMIILDHRFGLYNYIIMYPEELDHEKILKDNISKNEQIFELYIDEKEQYDKYCEMIKKSIWDSQKEPLKNKANEHKENMDRISEQLNKDISPYKWILHTPYLFLGHKLFNVYYKARGIFCLEKCIYYDF